MRAWRILYIVALIASVILALAFFYRYRLKDQELGQYRQLSQMTEKAFVQVKAQLAQSEQELAQSLKAVEQLNLTIAGLEKDNVEFKQQLEALRKEREDLQAKVSLLTDQKLILERRAALLEEKFHSLEDLREAIKIAKIERRQRRKIEKIEERLAKMEMLKAMDEIALQQGNRGFVIKDGQSTLKSPRIKVELEPIDNISYK